MLLIILSEVRSSAAKIEVLLAKKATKIILGKIKVRFLIQLHSNYSKFLQKLNHPSKLRFIKKGVKPISGERKLISDHRTILFRSAN
jgi:lantibiotic modifying enzyme